MKFDDIIGQSVVVDSLRRSIAEDKVANGYIFHGPKGCGKKLTAFIFAAALNCKADKAEAPCEACSSCSRMKSGNHPNLDVVRPTGASIKIKQIRELISEVAKKPFENGYKIVILEDAEKMTQDAQDAFLKTLEEPPERTVFILLVENQYSLLPTIVSRCQVFPIKPVSRTEVEYFLKRHCQKPEDLIKLASACSNGIIGRAVQILQDEVYLKKRNGFVQIADLMLRGSGREASGISAETVDTRQDAEELLSFLLGWLRDIAVYRELGEDRAAELLINLDKLENIRYHSNFLTESKLNSIMDIMKKTKSYINHNVSIKNSIDGMLLNVSEVCNGKNNWSKV